MTTRVVAMLFINIDLIVYLHILLNYVTLYLRCSLTPIQLGSVPPSLGVASPTLHTVSVTVLDVASESMLYSDCVAPSNRENESRWVVGTASHSHGVYQIRHLTVTALPFILSSAARRYRDKVCSR